MRHREVIYKEAELVLLLMLKLHCSWLALLVLWTEVLELSCLYGSQGSCQEPHQDKRWAESQPGHHRPRTFCPIPMLEEASDLSSQGLCSSPLGCSPAPMDVNGFPMQVNINHPLSSQEALAVDQARANNTLNQGVDGGYGDGWVWGPLLLGGENRLLQALWLVLEIQILSQSLKVLLSKNREMYM